MILSYRGISASQEPATLTKYYRFGEGWEEFGMSAEVFMNLPEIFVQLLKVAVSLPNDYLKQRKDREALVRFVVHIVSHHKHIFLSKSDHYLQTTKNKI